MDKKILVIYLVMITALALAFFGCQSKMEKKAEVQMEEFGQTLSQGEQTAQTSPSLQAVVINPPQPQVQPQEILPMSPEPQALPQEEELSREKKIQKALKNAGLYTGGIDGVIGSQSLKAIREFQASKGLEVDGKVGPKTWAELEKYLTP